MSALDRILSWFLEPPSPAARAPGPAAGEPPPASWLRRLADRSASRGRRADPADEPAPENRRAAARISTAAVLGRPGQAEPVAAAVALALSRRMQARTAAVAVIGTVAATAPAAVGGDDAWAAPGGDGVRVWAAGDGAPVPGGGTRAARRLGARLDAHGLPAHARGRLVWVGIAPERRQAAARRACLLAAPAVLAVTAPRTPEIEELLGELDLLVLVMDDPDGPLARVAALAPGGVPIAVTRPLARGPARTLAQRGLVAPRAIRDLVDTSDSRRGSA
jgi:hypothetical protein